MSPKSPFHLTFLLFEGFSNMVLASAIEPLRAARDLSGRRLFSWQLCSLDGGAIASSSRALIGADLPLARVGATDALILVAGYGMRNHLNHDSSAAVRRKARGLPMVGGLDTGAWLLARMGLLGGRRATIHWMERKELAENFPELQVIDAPYVVDGNIVTCGDAQSVLSWSLDLIGTYADEALRFDVANMFGRVESLDERATAHGLSGRLSDQRLPIALQRAIISMRETAEQPLRLPGIAERVALSTRGMDRLFHTYLGVPAGEYYRQIRLAHARALALETNLSLYEIASRTGFSSPSTLARAYRIKFGETLRQRKAGDTPKSFEAVMSPKA
ncbi:MAG: GlxA family transcriptional regulator [Rhizobiaceae bacterium]|nr:GlxA family transcriptional regulator [Rhizobiaceae bacterium]